MLLRLAYLTMANAFAVLHLLPMSDQGKDIEILALRHQITVLERQLGKGGCASSCLMSAPATRSRSSSLAASTLYSPTGYAASSRSLIPSRAGPPPAFW